MVMIQRYTFDFFNYAGIHRTVHLYTTPAIYIEDIKVLTDLTENHIGKRYIMNKHIYSFN